MLRLPANSTPEELKIFLHQPTRYYKTHPAPRLGAVYRAGKESYSTYQQWRSGRQHWPVAKSAYKTIYQIRLNLIKSSAAAVEPIFNISRSETFKSRSQIHL